MPVVTVGMVFHSDPDKIDSIIQSLKTEHGIDVVAVKQSWGKLWLSEVKP